MKNYVGELKKLQVKIVEKEKKGREIDELETKRQELYLVIDQLEKTNNKKKEKVEKLEQPGITKFFASFGNLDEKLSKEKMESANALKQYEEAKKELENIEKELTEYKADIEDINNCRRKYKELLEEQKAYIMDEKPEIAAQISGFDDDITSCDKLIRKIDEVIGIGYDAMKYVNKIAIATEKGAIGNIGDTFAELSNAENWANAELFNDAGIADNYERKNHKNKTKDNLRMLQAVVEKLQEKIKELENVKEVCKAGCKKAVEAKDWFACLNENYQKYNREVISVKQMEEMKQWLSSLNEKLVTNRSNLVSRKNELSKKKEGILLS